MDPEASGRRRSDAAVRGFHVEETADPSWSDPEPFPAFSEPFPEPPELTPETAPASPDAPGLPNVLSDPLPHPARDKKTAGTSTESRSEYLLRLPFFRFPSVPRCIELSASTCYLSLLLFTVFLCCFSLLLFLVVILCDSFCSLFCFIGLFFID